MVHNSRVPVWMPLLSPSPICAPCKTEEMSLGSEAQQEIWDLAPEYVPLYVIYMFSLTSSFPSLWLFLTIVCLTNRVFLLKWLSQLAGCGHLIQPFSHTSEGFKKEVLYSVLSCNSYFRILKPINSHVILLYFSAFIIILPPSILKSVTRKKRSAQVTTKYTLPKKRHT